MPRYLIRDDDHPLAIVETADWYGTRRDYDSPEQRIIKVHKRLHSPIFPIRFTWCEDRDVKTFLGETIEDFQANGAEVLGLTDQDGVWYVEQGPSRHPFITQPLKAYLRDCRAWNR